MAHHAYLYVGNQELGIEAARAYAAKELSIEGADHPDFMAFSYEGLFPKEDVQRIITLASQAPVQGDRKMIVLAAGRLFYQTQNALLKLFEEPTESTTLVLVVPAHGILLPTMRSRLIELPLDGSVIAEEAHTFMAASAEDRMKLVTKLVARSKSDKDAEKQAARMEAVRLADGLVRAAYEARTSANGTDAGELDRFLADLDRFMPILHEASAPLKLIFEHLLIVMPKTLSK